VEISPRKFTLENIFMGALCVSHRGSDGIGKNPFALVGHSFGGLVIKALVTELKRCSCRADINPLAGKSIRKAKQFLDNLKLVVFYAVPHSGADAETLLRYVNSCQRGPASRLPENMKPSSTRMAKMSTMMQDAFYNKEVNIYAFGEGKSTYDGKVCTHALILGFCFLHK
jgi:triacylglycerol esterase/lipase EstA (alpha/beta hydrolase family)